MRFLFVCTGNICRSPFAEAAARRLAGVEAASAGTIAVTGATASPTGVTVAAELGVDMASHRANDLTPQLIAGADVVYGMSQEHVAAVLALDPGAHVELLDPDGADIPDPYGGDRTEYRASYALIQRALERRLAEGSNGPGETPPDP